MSVLHEYFSFARTVMHKERVHKPATNNGKGASAVEDLLCLASRTQRPSLLQSWGPKQQRPWRRRLVPPRYGSRLTALSARTWEPSPQHEPRLQLNLAMASEALHWRWCLHPQLHRLASPRMALISANSCTFVGVAMMQARVLPRRIRRLAL